MDWPELPTTGFITGRTATIDDVKAGQAAFSAQGGNEGTLQIVIPQYAIWIDESGTGYPVVVIQAERGPNGLQIVGLLNSDGSHSLATLAELELLGTEKPE